MTHIGLIGLGKMGGNMRQRLRNKGIEVTGYARSRDVSDVDTIADLVQALPTPRTVWVMVPHGQPTDDVINELVKHLDKGDLIIEGGNSRFSDDIRHAAELAEKGIGYLDCGVSGGVWGLQNGYGLMVGGHVTPIDHAYLGLKSLSKPASQLTAADYVAVTAPADGVITEVSNLGSPNSHRVVIDHGCNVYSVYMVLNKVTGVLASLAAQASNNGYLKTNVKVKAGEEFGRQAETMLDFNVFDGTSWLSGFQNPQAYLTQDTWKPYTADFLPFFSGEIRSAIEAQLQKTSSPRVGKIDHDIAGTASGNWFLSGTNGYGGRLNSDYEKATSMLGSGSVPGKNDYSWSHLAIAPHQVDSNAWVFSSGWWNDPNGDADQAALVIGSGQVTPDKLTASSGMVVYKLAQLSYAPPAGVAANPPGSMAPWPVGYTVKTGSDKGVVALQVNADGTLSVEINTSLNSISGFTAFTSAKRTYNR